MMFTLHLSMRKGEDSPKQVSNEERMLVMRRLQMRQQSAEENVCTEQATVGANRDLVSKETGISV
jgi:hypothetical protein